MAEREKKNAKSNRSLLGCLKDGWRRGGVENRANFWYCLVGKTASPGARCGEGRAGDGVLRSFVLGKGRGRSEEVGEGMEGAGGQLQGRGSARWGGVEGQRFRRR